VAGLVAVLVAAAFDFEALAAGFTPLLLVGAGF